MAVWGVVSTVKAPLYEVIKFVAHHLSMGASYFVIYLDEPDPDTIAYFADDLDVRIIPTDSAYWSQHGNRPSSIEGRQIANINHALGQLHATRRNLKWVAHIDIDEFIVNHAAKLSISQKLKRLPEELVAVRMSPIENLISPAPTHSDVHFFKALMFPFGRRMRLSPEVFPDYGDQIIGGFLSHKNGKSMFRVTETPIKVGIHHVKSQQADADTVYLRGYELAHFHVTPWDQFEQLYELRRREGSYRPINSEKTIGPRKLPPVWKVLDDIEQSEGREGVKRLYDALCVATPDLQKRLANFNLLRRIDMQFEHNIARYFPDAAQATARRVNAD